MSFCNFRFFRNLFSFQNNSFSSNKKNKNLDLSQDKGSKSMDNILKDLDCKDYSLFCPDNKNTE